MRAPLLPSLLLSLSALFALSGIEKAQAQGTSTYRNEQYRFEIVFPDEPSQREVLFTTKDGSEVAAQQFYVEEGTNEYRLTVVQLPDGPAIDTDAIEHAADQIRLLGEVRFQYEVAYDPGVPGWQLQLTHADGRQVRATVYMWDHYLYVVQATTEVADTAALVFDQSIFLLNADGTEVDTGTGNTPSQPEL